MIPTKAYHPLSFEAQIARLKLYHGAQKMHTFWYAKIPCLANFLCLPIGSCSMFIGLVFESGTNYPEYLSPQKRNPCLEIQIKVHDKFVACLHFSRQVLLCSILFNCSHNSINPDSRPFISLIKHSRWIWSDNYVIHIIHYVSFCERGLL